MSLAVFFVAFLLLFLGMDRVCYPYDEGIMLTGAMRVAAGNVPHRDFYVYYGPAEFYILAWLFKLFGPSVFVERIFDLSVKAGIVAACFAWCAVYCRKSMAILTAAVCWIWLFSFTFYGPPVMPTVLLSLAGSWFLLRAYSDEKPNRRLVAAGAITGLTALFRYDVGFGLLVTHLCFIAFKAVISGQRVHRLRDSILKAFWYVAGTTIIFAPPALMYLAVAPIHSFIFDIILYPSKYYARARGLPFPGIHRHTLDSLGVYLPILVMAMLIGLVLMNLFKRRHDHSASPSHPGEDINQFLVLFGLLILVFYGKGLVRVSTFHMFLSLASSLIVIAVLLERIHRYDLVTRSAIACVTAFAIFTALLAGDHTAKELFPLQHSSVLAELTSPPGPASISNLTSWCDTPNPLHTGLCFLVDADHIKAIEFIDDHTTPKDQLFIGSPHHDKIFANDILTYFATQRMPATRWYDFNPDLQTRADIQREMISEIASKPVPYILLDSEFDSFHEPNDSSKSSGVTLLDDFIRDNYRQVDSFGTISVWERQRPQTYSSIRNGLPKAAAAYKSQVSSIPVERLKHSGPAHLSGRPDSAKATLG